MVGEIGATIRVRGLTKRYGDHVVLDGVDFDVAAGEILGYVGPNGSGKTTTLRILAGMLGDFEGEARVAGYSPREDPLEVKRRIGFVPENAVLYESLPVAEYLLFVGRMHGLEDELLIRRAEGVLDALELKSRLGDRIGALSKGMRQKVLLTAGLVHDPDVLFLDEPLSGLDVNSSLLVKEVVRGLARRGKAVLFSSHVMDVVERLCDRIAILHGGRIAAVGRFEELSERLAGSSLESIFAGLTGEGDAAARAERVLEALEGP